MSESKRVGDWMQTFAGRMFWPLDPRAVEIYLDDIAHALANQCRFAGHVRKFYSVAEHSVRVSLIVPPEQMLAGLLHDAAEAYLVDLPRPIKRSPGIGPAYRVAEAAVAAAVAERFQLPANAFETSEIHVADNILLMTEMRDLMAPPPHRWVEQGVLPLAEIIVPWPAPLAEMRFIVRFHALAARRKEQGK